MCVIPPLPTPTLFPHTTLFRSAEIDAGDAACILAGQHRLRVRLSMQCARVRPCVQFDAQIQPVAQRTGAIEKMARSEEHTSELQSPCNLVCRLLLEKKKTVKDT